MVSETEIQQQIRLESGRRGTPLLRNNSGATFDQSGRMIRFGLGNDSAKINKVFKSSDLIGIWPRLITTDMVGQTIGQFFAVEVKRPGYARDERFKAQENFAEWVRRHGGLAYIATSPTEVWGE